MVAQQNSRTKSIHGGNLTLATKEFGLPADGWIDLSTGINPTCYPNTIISSQTLRILPTPDNVKNLVDRARQFYQISNNTGIIAAPGTQSVLQNIPLLYPGRKITILSPTYSEHRKTWELAGNKVLPVDNFEALLKGDIAVLVNPNNPDGRSYKKNDLMALSNNLELLIIDEAFCDNSPNLSLAPHLSGNNILILRSLGKFFGLAGLRLGFAIGPNEILESLQERLGPWAVSGPAIEIGARALSDTPWFIKMQKQLNNQSKQLNSLLKQQSISILGGTELFTLIQSDRALDLYHDFGNAGILVRRFEERKNWLRIGLPGPKREWHKFANVLSQNSNTIDNMSK
jgi:cobalamin biosynthetic protein CobC